MRRRGTGEATLLLLFNGRQQESYMTINGNSTQESSWQEASRDTTEEQAPPALYLRGGGRGPTSLPGEIPDESLSLRTQLSQLTSGCYASSSGSTVDPSYPVTFQTTAPTYGHSGECILQTPPVSGARARMGPTARRFPGWPSHRFGRRLQDLQTSP
jgi:hypothetical protein